MCYQNGKIYKLICSQTGNVYIGSTIQTLKKRLRRHKSFSNDCISKSFINPTIHLIKNFPCNSIKELGVEERKFIDEINCVNIKKPGRTNAEYRLDNSDKIKQWRLDNADKIKQWRLENKDKIYEKFNCECGGKYQYKNKSKHLKTKKHLNFINTS